jgi:hypothetical protein
MAAGRLVSEVVIEGDDAVHFRPSEVERLGDERHGRRRHVTEGGLHIVENGKQRTFAARVAADDVVALRFAPRRHAETLQMATGRTTAIAA